MRYARALLTAFVLLVVVAAVATWLLRSPPGAPPHAPAQARVTPAAARALLPPAEPARVAPSVTKPAFDVVRVAPGGSAVLAGRAAPGAQVTVRDHGQALGVAETDRNGQWVLVPDRALPPGGQELTLSAKLGGRPAVAGDAPVVLSVPAVPAVPQQTAAAAPLAVLTPANAAPKVLQAPRPVGTAAGALGVEALDYDAKGAVHLAGTAPPGAVVRVYLDNHAVGDARAGADGRWTLAPQAPVAAGEHALRADQLSRGGQVVARVALPFRRVTLPEGVGAGEVVVRRGQNLWLIAQHAYGQGVRYTVIYAANRGAIRDPNLIYPGQVFAIPALGGSSR